MATEDFEVSNGNEYAEHHANNRDRRLRTSWSQPKKKVGGRLSALEDLMAIICRIWHLHHLSISLWQFPASS